MGRERGKIAKNILDNFAVIRIWGFLVTFGTWTRHLSRIEHEKSARTWGRARRVRNSRICGEDSAGDPDQGVRAASERLEGLRGRYSE